MHPLTYLVQGAQKSSSQKKTLVDLTLAAFEVDEVKCLTQILVFNIFLTFYAKSFPQFRYEFFKHVSLSFTHV